MSNNVHSEDDLLLPAWFWDTPASDLPFAVGYSNTYTESDHAFDDAFNYAALRLFMDMHCHVKGEKASASSPNGTMHMGSTIHVVTDTTGLAAFKSNVIRLDSARAPEMLIMLVSTGETEVNRQLIKQPVKSKDEKAVSGSAPLYLHQSSSWIEAERIARKELAISISASVKVVDRKEKGKVVKTMVTSTDVNLNNVQTTKRRFDKNNQIVKVWVHGKGSKVR